MTDSAPIVFISYAREDEPEKPDDGKVRWLSFVKEYLQSAHEDGAIQIWTDQLMPGGANWESEIRSRLKTCDIFVLLVSRHSLASRYISKVEIDAIRERQAAGEDVHFYPLLLTPTPNHALAKVQDKNLRPHGARPFSSYSIHEREQHMADAADEIVQFAKNIAERKKATVRAAPSGGPIATTVIHKPLVDVAALAHPRSHKRDRGPLHPCTFHIMSPHYLSKGRWRSLADVLVDIKDDLPDEDWAREAFLVPSKLALPKLRDPKLLKENDSRYLRLKREATQEFVKIWEHRELLGVWFTMPTAFGQSVGVYSGDYDRFLNAAAAKGQSSAEGAAG